MKRTFGVFLLFTTLSLSAQVQQKLSSVELYKQIQKLNFLGSVLYVAAHPDDENTSLISYLSNHTNARVGYLSINRGDGGQNIIGSEMGELLGVIRTQELLAARHLDGGEQFFTRAIDFGFSKNPVETFEYWNKKEVLSDVVWVYRKFRPDVIINRFNHRTEGDTHGHHTASAILSDEAFDLAGDENEFRFQLDEVKPWQPRRMYFNDSWFFYGSKENYLAADHTGHLEMDLGVYLPMLGKSNTEISALSRSQHKSQGFGSLSTRGSDSLFLEPIKGDLNQADKAIFAGIDTSWNRVKGGEEIGAILEQVQSEFDFEHPYKSQVKLLQAYRLIKELEDDFWREVKTKEIKDIIANSAGLYLEAYSSTSRYGIPGEESTIEWEVVNRSPIEIQLTKIEIQENDFYLNTHQTLSRNEKYEWREKIKIPVNIPYSSPYWLRERHSEGMYSVSEAQLIGLPEAPAALKAKFHLEILGEKLEIERDIIYRTSDQIKGELKEPFSIVPKVSLSLQDKVAVFPRPEKRKIEVEVQSFADGVAGELSLKGPEDWQIKPDRIAVELDKQGQRKSYTFEITPPTHPSEGDLTAEFSIQNEKYTEELHLIDYEHIPLQTVLLPARTKVNRLAIQIGNKKIAYLHGAGDEIPKGLREIGYDVTELSTADLNSTRLREFDAVILGIRTYNINKDIILNQNILFDYVKQGGTLLTQYSQSRGLLTDQLAPYPMKLSSKRVTDQRAAVKFLAPEHPVLHTPNKISQRDFDGWVQERGLYFAEEYGKEFTAVFGMRDPGEEELQGSLLIAPYGEGHFVYTGLSFFRQIPAGVPGAYRLLANILAL